jgi:hypothetical protein
MLLTAEQNSVECPRCCGHYGFRPGKLYLRIRPTRHDAHECELLVGVHVAQCCSDGLRFGTFIRAERLKVLYSHLCIPSQCRQYELTFDTHKHDPPE